MRFTTFDTEQISSSTSKRLVGQLSVYRKKIQKILDTNNHKRPEYALIHAANPDLHSLLNEVQKDFKSIKELIVVGIGGSSLGVEAVHTALGQQKVRLSVLDTIAPYELDILTERLKKYKKTSDIAICIISKSGTTAETVVNASVLLDALHSQYGKDVYKQVLYIGDEDSPLRDHLKRKKARCYSMPKAVGGRFSVATEVGLIPLALLGHDTDSYISGVLAANESEYEQIAVEGAALIAGYLKKGYRHYNFFAFEKRLNQVGAWYRQLFAESLGKSMTRSKKPLKHAMLPTITTPVELHSVGQAYFSGLEGVFTEFVVFEDEVHEHKISKLGLAKRFGGFFDQEIATAMYAGVVSSYQERNLPYRSVIFDEANLAYSLGLYMSLRMREVMYVAELLDINAFNQPNVELYKKKTSKILGV